MSNYVVVGHWLSITWSYKYMLRAENCQCYFNFLLHLCHTERYENYRNFQPSICDKTRAWHFPCSSHIRYYIIGVESGINMEIWGLQDMLSGSVDKCQRVWHDRWHHIYNKVELWPLLAIAPTTLNRLWTNTCDILYHISWPWFHLFKYTPLTKCRVDTAVRGLPRSFTHCIDSIRICILPC